MPYKRRYTRRRKYAKGAVSRKRVAAIAKRVVTRMAEDKYLNTTIATGASTSWQFGTFLACSQGTTASTRLGETIRLKRIEVFLRVTPVTTMAVTGTQCRVILYHNKQAAGALPSAAMIFDANGTINATRNTDQVRRITVVRDIVHTMVVTAKTDGVASNWSVGPIGVFKWVIYPKKKIQYTSNAGTISDLLLDDYGLGFLSDGNSCCNVDARVKVIFCDD